MSQRRMKWPFEGQVALVTGAGSGLGLATGKAFAESGASVVLADWNEESARSAADELAAKAHVPDESAGATWVRVDQEGDALGLCIEP